MTTALLAGLRRRLPSARRVIVGAAATLLVGACSAAPEPVHWGMEECAQCQMVISDERHAAQVVDRRGNTHKFDAIECMTAFLNNGAVAAADVHSLWVAHGRDEWIAVEDAHFVHSENIRSPMGGGLVAHATAEAARQLQAEVGGELLSWQAVLQLRSAPHAHHGSGSSHDGH